MPTKKESKPGLLARPVPKIVNEQIDMFARGIIHDRPVMTLDLFTTSKKLRKSEGNEVIGVDIGGDKLLYQSYQVKSGKLIPLPNKVVLKDDSGTGYIAELEKISTDAKKGNLPVGLSIGLELQGTQPVFNEDHKLQNLRNELRDKYARDFAKIFNSPYALLNDGPAGLVAGAIHAEAKYKNNVENVIFLINGGGIGAAVLTKNTVFSTEAGHVQLTPSLNRYNEQRICTWNETNFLCLQYVAGNKVGIEKIWQRKTGQKLSAIEIEKRYTENGRDGQLSLDLYDYSAEIVAHVAQGLARTFEIDITSPKTVIVGHGGAFKFPGYGERIQQILEKHNNSDIRLMLAKEFSENACAEGAAIAAVAGV